jgi:tetratricopeptide (TPR) repeat protein
MGEYDKAISDYSQVIVDLDRAVQLDRKGKNDQGRALSGRGRAHLGKGEIENMVADYTQAIEIQPDFNKSFELENDLAWHLVTFPDASKHDPARAIDLIKKAVKNDGTRGSYSNTLGVAQYRAGRFTEAIESLNESESLRPGLVTGHNAIFLAMAHWRLGQRAKAHDYYRQVIEWMDESQPGDEELRRFRAEAAELLGIEDRTAEPSETKPNGHPESPNDDSAESDEPKTDTQTQKETEKEQPDQR